VAKEIINKPYQVGVPKIEYTEEQVFVTFIKKSLKSLVEAINYFMIHSTVRTYYSTTTRIITVRTYIQ
jgi:hypothetical protein